MSDAGTLEPAFTLFAKKSSPTMSSFNPSKILPEPFPLLDDHAFNPPPLFPAIIVPQMSSDSLHAAPSVFSAAEEHVTYTEPTRTTTREPSHQGEPNAYDLKPPPPTISRANAELLSDSLFSVDHLNLILRDPTLSLRFTTFLNKFRPLATPILVRYLESQKAIAAIRYANAIAEQITSLAHSSSRTAAILDPKFESRSRRAVDELVSDALPAYITYRLTHVVTECLVKEITGNNAPIMRELVQGLAEVYCLTDPSLPDNPIVYASEEFYKTTQYGREYVIGRNCRFLQGPKTSTSAIARIAEALHQGQEISETLVNYRRDGTPFINLVMMAPLYDNKGSVRYFIGCQVDITNLIDGGRGLESLQRLLAQDPVGAQAINPPNKSSLHALADLGRMLGNDEIDVLRERAGLPVESGRSTPNRPGTARRFVGMEDPPETNIWPPSHFGSSGRLPAVYQNYLLVRPYPSLRITFTSSALRIPGLLQSHFLDRVGGPTHVREGISEALAQGVGVTAKISWLTNIGDHDSNKVEGKPRWIHCTPLMGSDSKVGVWMIAMVEKEDITGSINAHSRSNSDGWPLKGAANPRFNGGKLYADYLRREGRTESPRSERSSVGSHVGSARRSDSMRIPPAAEESFRDF